MPVDQPNTMPAPAFEPEQTAPDRLTLIAFALFVIVGGGVAIGIRFTYSELAPYWGGTLRFGIAAVIFWALVFGSRAPIPRGQGLLGAALFGVLSVGLAFLFVYYGLLRTPASLYQTIVAIVPLLTLLFAWLHGLEKLRPRGVAGALIALTGIGIALSGTLSAGVEVSPPHIFAILLGAASFAEAGVVAKLFPRNHPFATNAVAMTMGALILLIASLVTGEPRNLPTSSGVWLALVYLVFATITLFLLYLFILGRWTASGTSYSFVLIPIGTVILASFLVDESISSIFLAGGALVLIGVWIGAIRPHPKPEEGPDDDLQVRPGLPNCS
jgi:drug/metabolite transporter (DMT)-like permease